MASNVVVLSGADDFLRLRSYQKNLSKAMSTGRRIVHLPVGDNDGLSDLLDSAFLFAAPVLAVIQGRSKVSRKSDEEGPSEDAPDTSGWSPTSVSRVVEHAASGDQHVLLYIVQETDLAVTSFAAKILAQGKSIRHNAFPAAKRSDKEQGVTFLQAELKGMGLQITDSLAEAVVSRVGMDRGVLAFEALKYGTLAKVRGVTAVGTAEVQGLIATFGSREYFPLMNALGNRDLRGVVRELKAVCEGPAAISGGVPALARSLGTTTVGWLQVATLLDRDFSEFDIAKQMGLSPQRIHFQAVTARKWGVQALVSLIRGLAAVDRGVRTSYISPWVTLEVNLIRACMPDSSNPR